MKRFACACVQIEVAPYTSVRDSDPNYTSSTALLYLCGVLCMCILYFTIFCYIFSQEFKAQCFGGDYTGEVYDHVLKKSVVGFSRIYIYFFGLHLDPFTSLVLCMYKAYTCSYTCTCYTCACTFVGPIIGGRRDGGVHTSCSMTELTSPLCLMVSLKPLLCMLFGM